LIRGGFILLLFLLLGEGAARLSGLPIPGSVVGMLLLAGALRLGVIRLHWVEGAARAILGVMGLLFVPAGVGIVLYGELLSRQGVAIVVACVVSTLLVLAVVGLVQQRLERR
jgi:holin-like protein